MTPPWRCTSCGDPVPLSEARDHYRQHLDRDLDLDLDRDLDLDLDQRRDLDQQETR